MTGRSYLVIQLRQIGDVVLTTPIPRILKEAEPGCRVAFLTERPSDQLLAGNPWIDEILVSDRSWGLAGNIRFGRSLRERGFDAVLDFMANPRSAVIGYCTGAPLRVSYPSPGRGLLYTHRLPHPAGAYAVAVKKRLLEPLGISSDRDCPEIYLTEGELEAAREVRRSLLAGGAERLLTVDASHKRAVRQWPPAHFGALCERMGREGGAVALALWGPGEEAAADAVVAAAAGHAVRSPRTTLRQAAALIAVSDLHLGNCSAPRHLAVAVGTPSFTVLGSTASVWTHPDASHADVALGLDCQPCRKHHCNRELACLLDLSPEQVFDSLRRWATEVLGWRWPAAGGSER